MKLSNLFKDVGSEIKKITWPTRKETIKYTLIVIGISVAVAMFLGSFDFVFVRLMERFIFK
ncbi:MAG: preprotein translocase subunit SecE [Candidatus Paceibacterota bacterium]|jgi:preprotein translocase subunit SecE|nr:preprotein translocase subunit SecE [Candidatus Paceibacterota bacterium]MDD5555420.1 preprotein translocase subunit SecE [Candidatus Paceibacterota bacterium]